MNSYTSCVYSVLKPHVVEVHPNLRLHQCDTKKPDSGGPCVDVLNIFNLSPFGQQSVALKLFDHLNNSSAVKAGLEIMGSWSNTSVGHVAVSRQWKNNFAIKNLLWNHWCSIALLFSGARYQDMQYGQMHKAHTVWLLRLAPSHLCRAVRWFSLLVHVLHHMWSTPHKLDLILLPYNMQTCLEPESRQNPCICQQNTAGTHPEMCLHHWLNTMCFGLLPLTPNITWNVCLPFRKSLDL